MSDKEVNKILAHELGKIGAMGGQVSRITGIGNPFIQKVSGYLGANLAARFLPNNEFEIKKRIIEKPENFLPRIFNVLTKEGQILNELCSESTSPIFAAVIGSGFLNLNPAIVFVQVSRISDSEIEVVTTGIAKEGLIKQYAGEKAAKRIAEKLFA